MNKTTSSDFKVFKSECDKWIDTFGLKAWSVHYEHKDVGKDTLASCYYDVTNRIATLVLSKGWDDDEVTDYQVRKSAFHEVCELLMANMRTLAEYRYTTRLEIEEEIHAIIRTLENTIYRGGRVEKNDNT